MTNNYVPFDQTLWPMTSIVEGSYSSNEGKARLQASGFFYTELTPTSPNKNEPQWMKVDNYWFITNRHVIAPYNSEGEEVLLEEVVIMLRKIEDAERIDWFPIVLDHDEIKANTKFHQDSRVDVVAIDISNQMKNIFDGIATGKIENNLCLPVTLSNLNIPNDQPIPLEVTSDVIVASYPKGFYDNVNKFPIVKSGIVASFWGANFKGLPMFQIDAQLFPGSSGGMVISKPTHIGQQNGQLFYSVTKQFVLLGVYSGEYFFKDEVAVGDKTVEVNRSYGLGNVWYSSLIPEIIRSGIRYQGVIG